MQNNSFKTQGYKSKLKSTRKNMMIKFFTIVFGVVGGFILLSTAIAFAFLAPGYHSNTIIDPETGVIVNENQNNFFINRLLPPQRTSFLIIGLDDDDMRADVVILGVFNREINQVDLISIPRDVLVNLSQENRAYLTSNGRRAPTQTKYADLFAHGGVNHGASIIRKHTEEFFGVSIDYQVIIGLDAFVKIVDEVGPITMEIPAGGLFYKDPVQDLIIAIPEGIQQLDGRMAEGVVRYRDSYARADLQRIEMQQKFMEELFRQTLQRDTIMNNIVELLEIFIEYVDTDFKIEDLAMYIPFVLRLEPESLVTHNISVRDVRIPDPYQNNARISYVIPDMDETRRLIDSIFYSMPQNQEADEGLIENPRIKVLNGGSPSGTASRVRNMLVEKGHNVIQIGDYTGRHTDNTRIIVSQEGLGDNLKVNFSSPTIQVDTNIEQGFDIIIITGRRQ